MPKRSWQSNRSRPVETVKPSFHQRFIAQALLAFWRWLPELVVLFGLVFLFVFIVRTQDLPTWAAACVIVAPVTVLLSAPKVGPVLRALFWVNVTRHRLRSFMAENGIRNRTGRLPWLLLIYPTRVGERAWMVLVAGIDVHDIETRLGSLGSTCWATEGRVVAHRKWSHLVRLDIIRRDPLVANKPVKTKLLPPGTEPELLPALPATTSTEVAIAERSDGMHSTPSQWAIGIGLPLGDGNAVTASGMRLAATTDSTAPAPSKKADKRTTKAANPSTNSSANKVGDSPPAIIANGEDVSDYV